MTPQTNIADGIGLAVIVAAVVFSPDVANVVGPYIVIVGLAAIGASFSLERREPTTRLRAVLFFARVCGLATFSTVLVSSLLASFHESLTVRILVAPVALVIGLIGDDLPAVGRWFASKLNALVDVLIKARAGKGGGGD